MPIYEYICSECSLTTLLVTLILLYWGGPSLQAFSFVLTTGVLVGTVEIVDCTEGDEWWHWHLKNPRRLKQPRMPKEKAKPVFFNPF